MMDFITLDMETFYDKQYSLRKMTTEEYINDPQFETIGVGIKFNSHKSHWFSGHLIEWALKLPDWSKIALICHNTKFDAAILAWKYGIRPAFLIDTMSMARPFHNSNIGCSLGKLVEYYGIGVKGHEVVDAMGKRAADFTPDELAAYGKYCINDCNLTFSLFNDHLRHKLPPSELLLIDTTIRMYTDSPLRLDTETIQQEIDLEAKRKADLLAMVDQPKGVFSSNDKFAEFLMQLGVTPPTKPSPKKKNPDGSPMQVWAFAKGDADFIALQDSDDPMVSAAVEVRLGVKSTQRETRASRFMGIAIRNNGVLPVPLGYYNAHTGRYGGEDAINLQNLQRTSNKDATKGLLRKAITAAEGEMLVVEDLSQIEARLLVWQANQMDRVEAFANKRDVYSEQASVIYGRHVDRKKNADDFVPGFIGKAVVLGCFTDKTMILSNHGWKPIIEITTEDLLWDGKEWVKHQGIVEKGEKEVVRAHGLEATSDHLIMTREGWKEWGEVVENPSLFQSALSSASLPFLNGGGVLRRRGKLNGIQSSGVLAEKKARLLGKIWSRGGLLDAGNAETKQPMLHGKNIGDTRRFFQTTRIENAYLTVFQRLLCAAKRGLLGGLRNIMHCGASMFIPHGQMALRGEGSSSSICLHLQDGTTRNLRSTASTTMGITNPATCGSLEEVRTRRTGGMSENCKSRSMTYDIAYAGPRNRFTVATDVGPIIVHNCGYGLGFVKFASMIYVGMLGEKGILFDGGFVQALGVDVAESIDWIKGKNDLYVRVVAAKPVALTMLQWETHVACAMKIINVFRSSAPQIVEYWNTASRALYAMVCNTAFEFGGPTGRLLRVEGTSIILPNGMPIRYEGLELDNEGNYSYLRRKEGRIQRVKTYGGSVGENITQALARIVITDNMTTIDRKLKYRVAMQVHDEVVSAVPAELAKQAQRQIRAVMRTPPAWAPTLPLDSDGGIAFRYGDAK